MLTNAGRVALYHHEEPPKRVQDQPNECRRKDWVSDALEGFKRTLDEADFPCLFARKALKQNSIRFLFVREAFTEQDLVSGVSEYMRFVKSTELKHRLYSPLVVFFQNSSKDNLKTEHEFAWQAIQKLHDHDAHAWPDEVAVSPESPQFTFCFQGIQLFINISCPSHIDMRSRNLGRQVTLVINPRENFDHVAGAETVSGTKIRERIRSRVKLFNNGITPLTLGFYGDEDSLEWRQYQLEEPGGLYASACPLKIRSN